MASFKSVLVAGAVAGTMALGASLSANAAVTMAFNNSNDSSHPFHPSNIRDTTTFSGSVTDPDFGGGTSATFTFSNPARGVDVSDPDNPDHSTSSAAQFGAESSGFGVHSFNSVGRFERGATMTLQSTHAFSFDQIRIHEWDGKELLHISWTENGQSKSNVFSFENAIGTGPHNMIVDFSGIVADANTSVVFTNVSPSDAGLSGRIRFGEMTVSLVPEPASLALMGLGGLAMLRRRR